MVERLDCGHLPGDLRIMVIEVVLELGLGSAGADNQDLGGILHGVGDGVEIGLVDGVAAVALASPGVDVRVVLVRTDRPLLVTGGAGEDENLRLFVVDPDGGVGRGNGAELLKG